MAADAVVASYSWVVLLGVVGDVSPFFAVFGSSSGRRQQTSLVPDLRICDCLLQDVILVVYDFFIRVRRVVC